MKHKKRPFTPSRLESEAELYFQSCAEQSSPEHLKMPLLEELLCRLGMSLATWESIRDSKEDEKLSDTMLRIEQRFTANIIQAAYDNPKLISLATHLTRQRHYGAYGEKSEPSHRETLIVRLEGASAPFD